MSFQFNIKTLGKIKNTIFSYLPSNTPEIQFSILAYFSPIHKARYYRLLKFLHSHLQRNSTPAPNSDLNTCYHPFAQAALTWLCDSPRVRPMCLYGCTWNLFHQWRLLLERKTLPLFKWKQPLLRLQQQAQAFIRTRPSPTIGSTWLSLENN